MKLIKALCFAVTSAVVGSASMPLLATAADATKDYPSRPIRYIMPNAPGSSNDTLGRIVAAKLGEALGQQIVVDNRAGAGGILGMEIGKNANPDGYTLVAASTAAMSIAPHLHKKLPYDPVKDFEFISLYAVTPNILVVTPRLPIKTVKELIDYAKSKNGQINMASAGAGAQSHLSGAAFMYAAKMDSLHVPYKGGGASVAAVVAGESQWTLTPAPAVWALVKSGRLRAIGQSLAKRTPLLGDLPSIAETVKGFDYSGWNGMLAPKGTPNPILAKLRETLVKVVNSPEVKAQFEAQAAQVTTDTPEEFRKLVANEIKSVAPVVKAAGLTAN